MAQEAQRRVIGGRYRLVKTLYTGGFGRVWQAHDQRLHDDVAVKEVWLPPAVSAAERTERLVRAEREARNAVRLRNHPNIVTVRDVVVEDGVPWIVMRLVTGHSLAEDIAASGPLSAGQVAYVADSLLKALGAAHTAGIVHRDVKPANVLFTENGEVLLTDFGIAVQKGDSTLTATGMLVGSLDYIAPERVRDQDDGAPGDLFSLGVTLYQAVTGVSPFRRDTVAASLAAILFQEPPPPRCSAGLAAFIMRLLAKDPRQRPTIPAARAMLAALPTTGATPTARAASVRTPTARAASVQAPSVRPPSVPAPSPPVRPRSTPRRPTPTRVAPAPALVALAPPRRPMPRRRPWRGAPTRRPTWHRYRRRSGVPVVVLVALVLLGLYAAWGRGAADATTGDCVYHRQQGWHIEPCALPVPGQEATYRVLDRVEGTSVDCDAVPGWSNYDDDAAVLPGFPPVTLCLAPVH